MSILKLIGKFILDWLLTKAAGWLGQVWREYQANKKSKKENQEAREKLEKAQTPEEREDATKDIIGNF